MNFSTSRIYILLKTNEEKLLLFTLPKNGQSAKISSKDLLWMAIRCSTKHSFINLKKIFEFISPEVPSVLILTRFSSWVSRVSSSGNLEGKSLSDWIPEFCPFVKLRILEVVGLCCRASPSFRSTRFLYLMRSNTWVARPFAEFASTSDPRESLNWDSKERATVKHVAELTDLKKKETLSFNYPTFLIKLETIQKWGRK